MIGKRTGREPTLGGNLSYPLTTTGNEPMLGGERMDQLIVSGLMQRLHQNRTTHLQRVSIGDMLNDLGDPRPGVGLDENDTPDLVWCPVPPGHVTLRDVDDVFEVDAFYISRYPITWKQYRVFLESPDGFENLDWWDDLARRREYTREAFLLDNLPVQEVSWYDAVAYTRWLSYKLRYDVRLPTEWEWELAATGEDPRYVFPWGWRPGNYHANTRESRLRRATAVGMYPLGESPVGAMDMAGNVFEWCLNEFKDVHRVTIGGNARRSVRGGSWFQVMTKAYTFFRSGDNPYYRFNAMGFRLVTLDPTPAPLPLDFGYAYPGVL